MGRLCPNRTLGIRNWRSVALNRQEWWELLRKAKAYTGLSCHWWWWWWLHSDTIGLKYEWERDLFLCWFMCLGGLVRKTGDLRFKSQHRHNFFSQYLLLWRPNDIRGPCGAKFSWHLSHRCHFGGGLKRTEHFIWFMISWIRKSLC